jgi:hypothetical protein
MGGRVKDPPASKVGRNIRQVLPRVRAVAPAPSIYMTVPSPLIMDQGSKPECVCYACSGMDSDDQFRQSGTQYVFNPDWLYKQCKQQDGIPNEAGTYPSVALKIMQAQGMELAGCRQKPDLKWGISGSFAITAENTDEEIKQVLQLYGTIITAMDWYDLWMGTFLVFPDVKGLQPNGGHCINMVGWDDTIPIWDGTTGGWIKRNSWNHEWGEYGGDLTGMSVMGYSQFRSLILPQADCWKVIINQPVSGVARGI